MAELTNVQVITELTNVQAINKFFGKKEGQSMSEFMDEVKALTPEDKDWLGDECRKALAQDA